MNVANTSTMTDRNYGFVHVFNGIGWEVITRKQAAIDVIKSQPFFTDQAPKPEDLICPRCNVNRDIEPCPAINWNCPMEGEAAAPKPEE